MSDQWWSISGSELRRMLQQVADGDHPDVVMAEFYANKEDDDEPEGDPA